MILGILSDTHGFRERTVRAVQLLKQLGAAAFVHCGDVGGVGILDQLAGQRAWVVCGNTDGVEAGVLRYAETLGLVMGPGPLRFDLGGRACAVFHGHERQFSSLLEQASDSGVLPAGFGRCDYVFHGHTHNAADTQVGPLRVINPGALQRVGVPTVATLDLERDRLDFWQVSDNGDETAPRRVRPAAVR